MNHNGDNGVVVEVPAHEPETRQMLMKRRIRIWAPIVIIFGLLIFLLIDRPHYISKTVPEELVGEWTCNLPAYSDRYLKLTPSSITFGTGGTSFVKYKILGIEEGEIEGINNIVLRFRDVAGTEFRRTVVIGPSGETFHFASQPAVVWKRFGS
jgi:hypothetical protein